MINPELRQHVRLLNDGDSWGTCMCAWFDIAEILNTHGDDIPDEWQFRPGAGGSHDIDELDGMWLDLYREFGADALIDVGNVLDRWSQRIRARGDDY